MTEPPPYDDDPVSRRLTDQLSIVNHNAVLLGGLVELLLAKGLITNEELRTHRLRELADFDRQVARHETEQQAQREREHDAD